MSGFKKLKETFNDFTLTEKVLFWFFLILLTASAFSSLAKLNSSFLVEVPEKGGTLKEGLIGVPRFINPIIAISDTDRDISSLIYSGLLKINSDGELVNELAEDFSISEDGLNYYVKIKDDAIFHDGEPVTTDDLIFTIQKTQDPTIKSPKRPNFDGVIIQKINEKEIEFTLSQPYSPFIYNLTLGILPKHIWEEISSDEFAFSKYNLEPIGSGPYKVSKINKNGDGVIKKYTLKSFNKYALGEPFIDKIEFSFYKNEDELINALNKNSITSAQSISPNKIEEINLKNKNLFQSSFSRIFALYFNQSESSVLNDEIIREALKYATPKKEIIDNVLNGYGVSINSPIIKEFNEEEQKDSVEILSENGWELNEEGIFEKDNTKLSFSISTANVAELVKVTEILAENYRNIGVEVDLKIFEPNDLTLNVIRPREFESIFFGQVINRDLDYFAFWHSSQRNDPGLNIAGFTNIDADKALENIRASFTEEEKENNLQIFEKEVINDLPAIFLYSPDFIYIVSKDLKLNIPNKIVTSSDRFADVEKWYKDTDLVWEIFAD